ncbi:MAG: hypothetical protein ACI9BV_001991, partial [Rhodothermales bacterium]
MTQLPGYHIPGEKGFPTRFAHFQNTMYMIAQRPTNTTRWTVLILVCLFVGSLGAESAAARQEKDRSDEALAVKRLEQKERNLARNVYLFNLLRDPATNQIPPAARLNEVKFAAQMPSVGDLSNKSQAVTYAWNEAGPTDVGGRTRALVVDLDNSSILIAGGAGGGIWRSTNSGTSWTLVSDPHFGITAIAQDPRAGFRTTWYASTGESKGTFDSNSGVGANLFGSGLYKSTDNGASWSQVQSAGDPYSWDTDYDFVSRVVVSPTTGTVVFAENSEGLYRSSDGAASFANVYGTTNSHPWSDVAVDAAGNFIAVLAGAVGASTNGVYRSTDDGVTWSPVGTFPDPFNTGYTRSVIALAPSDQDVLYVMTYMGAKKTVSGVSVEDVRFHKITISTGTYEDRTANVPLFLRGDLSLGSGSLDTQGGYNMAIAVHPTDADHVFIGGTSLFRSRDGFATAVTQNDGWIGGYAIVDNFSQYANHHPDNHTVFFDPGSANRLYSGHDGGLSVSNDVSGVGPITWTKLNNGYNVTQFFTVSIARASGDDRILGGTQDNGSPYFRWNGTTATASADLSTGDGAAGFLGATSVYSSSQNGGGGYEVVSPSSDPSFGTMQALQPCTNCGQLFVNPLAVNPNNETNTFYPAGANLYRLDNALSWTQLTNLTLSTGYGFSALAMSTAPADILYYAAYSATGSPKIYRFANTLTATSGQTEISIPAAAVGGYVVDIAVNPTDANELLVVLSNYNVVGLYHSTDAGQNWTAVEGNLNGASGPSFRAAEIVPFGGETSFWLGTSIGLYKTAALNGAGTVWAQDAAAALGISPVAALDSRPADGQVVAATHGRGIFVGSASASVNVAPVAADASGTGNEDTGIAVTLSATDANGDALTYALASNPSNG